MNTHYLFQITLAVGIRLNQYMAKIVHSIKEWHYLKPSYTLSSSAKLGQDLVIHGKAYGTKSLFSLVFNSPLI